MQQKLLQKEQNETSINNFSKNNATIGELLQKNWNRISMLSSKRLTEKLSESEKAEIEYRVAVQNEYSNTGRFDKNGFVLPMGVA